MATFAKNFPFQAGIIFLIFLVFQVVYCQKEKSLRDCRCSDIFGKTNGPCVEANLKGGCVAFQNIHEERVFETHATLVTYECDCYDIDMNYNALKRLPMLEQNYIRELRERKQKMNEIQNLQRQLAMNKTETEEKLNLQRKQTQEEMANLVLQEAKKKAESEEKLLLQQKLEEVKLTNENNTNERLFLIQRESEHRLLDRLARLQFVHDLAKKRGFNHIKNSSDSVAQTDMEKYLQDIILQKQQHDKNLQKLWEERKRQQQYLMENQRFQLELAHAKFEEELKVPTRRFSNSSCLKPGTKILMADFTKKPVDLLQVDDLILDKDLQPAKVLWVSYEFLMNQKFYGFDNNSFFFTNSHIFAGPGENETEGNLRLYSKSTKNLFQNNPLMKYLNVSDMDNQEPLKLFHVEDDMTVSGKNVEVFEDPQEYPPETPIYFIQVDSPTGTYFANGYVCRHEIPPVEYWPNTMSVLFRLMGTESFEKLTEFPYTLETVSFLQDVTSQVAEGVKEFLERNELRNTGIGNDLKIMTLEDIDMKECIAKIFSNPTLSTAGVGLYAKVGEIIAPYLDVIERRPTVDVTSVAKYQHEIYHVINQELKKLL